MPVPLFGDVCTAASSHHISASSVVYFVVYTNVYITVNPLAWCSARFLGPETPRMVAASAGRRLGGARYAGLRNRDRHLGRSQSLLHCHPVLKDGATICRPLRGWVPQTVAVHQTPIRTRQSEIPNAAGGYSGSLRSGARGGGRSPAGTTGHAFKCSIVGTNRGAIRSALYKG